VPEKFLTEYLRVENLPTIWCAGCGLGTDMRAIVKAMSDLKLDKNRTVVVSGIGCSSRTPGYVDTNTVHTTHGRALAFATGIKLADPTLTVVVVMGDGDAAAIGGNHLIHAARRNIDMTAVVLNNNTYGMTSGQYSPLTPHGSVGTTAPYGNAEQPFDICALAIGAGATYVARTTTYHYQMITNLTKKAIRHRGFAFIEVLFQCPTYFGKFNKMGDPAEMLEWYRDNTVKVGEPNPDGKIVIGELHAKDGVPEYCDTYEQVINKARRVTVGG
jgi:2-oxoglutarate ferredoxin oxidoreductase subunit beta